jgi:hypothetical protein
MNASISSLALFALWSNTLFVESCPQVFNRPIPYDSVNSYWSTSTVVSMANMFEGNTVFNQDISTWAVDAVADFSTMFNGASVFNRDLCAWGGHITGGTPTVTNMFASSGCAGATSGDPSTGVTPITPLCFNCYPCFPDRATLDTAILANVDPNPTYGNVISWCFEAHATLTDLSSLFVTVPAWTHDISGWVSNCSVIVPSAYSSHSVADIEWYISWCRM